MSIINKPTSIIKKRVVIDNLVGSIVSYGNKVWFVRFPTDIDSNGEVTVTSFSMARILTGLDQYKQLYGDD